MGSRRSAESISSYTKAVKHVPVFSGNPADAREWFIHVESACMAHSTNGQELLTLMSNAQRQNERTDPAVALPEKDLYLLQAILLTKSDATTMKLMRLDPSQPLSVWADLQYQYFGSQDARASRLEEELRNLSYTSAGGNLQMVRRAMALYSELASLGERVTDATQVRVCLRKMSPSMKAIADAVRLQTRTVTSLRQLATLVAEEELEQRNSSNMAGEDATPAVAAAKRGGRSTGDVTCYNCHRKGHKIAECWAPGGPKEKNKPKNQKPKRDPTRKGRRNKKGAMSVCGVESKQTQSKNGQYFSALVDSGNMYGSHLTGDESLFASLEAVHQSTDPVRILDGMEYTVTGQGRVHAAVRLRDGSQHYLDIGMLLVPNLERTVLSTTKLAAAEIYYDSKKNHLYGDWGQARVDEYNNLNLRLVSDAEWNKVLREIPKTNVTASVHGKKETTDLNTWHARLAHQDKTMVQRLIKNSADVDISSTPKEAECEPCALGKSKAKPYPSTTSNPATRKLQRVHMDFCGPFPSEGPNGERHMFVLVDEFTGLIAVYPTKNKGDAPILMARFIDEFGTPEEVRSDNAPELVKGDMAALLEQCGIEAESTVPGSPQQNGLVEREIATFNALITTVLIEAKMPNTVWPYAARYVAYTRNRSLRARTGNKTAIELFYGVPPCQEYAECSVSAPNIVMQTCAAGTTHDVIT
jgi:hypothetical protein